TRRCIDLRSAAPMFDTITGYPKGYRVLGIPLGPTKPIVQGRVAIALGMPKNTRPLDLIESYRERLEYSIKPIILNYGPCKEIILTGDDIDLFKLPAPRIHGMDGGRYIGTWDICITKDPTTGWVNWGTYRSMIHDSKHLSILLTPGDQHGGTMFFNKYEPR